MTDRSLTFGYCTNVHAGLTLTEAKDSLLRYAKPIRELVTDGPLPVGLWLTNQAVESLVAEPQRIEALRSWLGDNHFVPYTFNGFPQGDFHQEVVKLAVYEPTWCCESRSKYTMELAEVLEALLPEGSQGSISTLPLGWPHAPWHAENFKAAADNLISVAKYLERLQQHRGTEIVLAIEPEPGCVLNTAPEVVEFFEHFLFSGPDADLVRRYITVCHDICHSGVMFESQRQTLDLYRRAGIRVGKVQVSSAVHVPWDEMRGDLDLQMQTLSQVREFSEPRYMHQTSRRGANGGLDKLANDLPDALRGWLPADQLATEQFPAQPWRIHFHVPIYLEQFGALKTTQADIAEVLSVMHEQGKSKVGEVQWFTGHYEVETYAWNVLPKNVAAVSLSEGITKELLWFEQQFKHVGVASV